MDFSETVAELEGFVGKTVWVAVFASDGGDRFSVLTGAGRFQKAGSADPVFARAVRDIGQPGDATFFLDESRVWLTLWANLLVGADWVGAAGARRLRLELRGGAGIDLAEFRDEEELKLLGLG
jgi:hypothetical protein